MYENTVATTETEVKKHPKAIKIIGIILAILLVIIASIYTSFYFTEKSYQKDISNISISNISSNSATISWTTYTKDTGQIEINIDDKFFFISALKKNQKFYDSRDIVEISQGKYELEQKGKYYVHHVTINGLEPETEYNYRFSTGIFTTSIGGKIKTFPIQESIKTPNPIYGYVFDQYGEPYDDVIVRAYVNNPNNGVSQNITSVTDKGIGWSMDIGTIYSVSGQDLSFEEDWTLVVEAIGPYRQKKIEVPNTKVKPVDNIVLERQSFTDEAEKAEITSKSRLNNILVGHVFADACSQIPVDDCPDFESIGCEVRYNKCVMTVPIVQPVKVDTCGDGICSDGEDCSQDCTCGNSKCDDTDRHQGCDEECNEAQNQNNNCLWASFCGPYISTDNTLCTLSALVKETLKDRGCNTCDMFISQKACKQTAEMGLNCNWLTQEKKCVNGDIKPAIQINKKYFCDETGSSLSECSGVDEDGFPTGCKIPKRCLSGLCIENTAGDDYCENYYETNQEENLNINFAGNTSIYSCGETYQTMSMTYDASAGEECYWKGSENNCVYGYTCNNNSCIIDTSNSACNDTSITDVGFCEGHPSNVSDTEWQTIKSEVNTVDTREMWTDIYDTECICNGNISGICEKCYSFEDFNISSESSGCIAFKTSMQCGSWINTLSNCAKYDLLQHEVTHFVQRYNLDKELIDNANTSNLIGCGFISDGTYTPCKIRAQEAGAEYRSNNGGGYYFTKESGEYQCGTQVYEEVKNNTNGELAKGILLETSCESYLDALKRYNYDFCSSYDSSILDYNYSASLCRTEEVLVGVTNENGSSILNNILIHKAKAQETEPEYRGIYSPEVEGYQTTSKYIYYSPGQEVKVFNDINKDGIKQDNEPILDSIAVDLEAQIHFADYDLKKGWNLISIPMVISDANGKTIQDSQQLLTYYQSQNIPIMHISTYRDGKWLISSRRGDIPYGETYSILPGEAYFVKAESKISFRLNGHRFTQNPDYDLNVGWNLIGIPNPITDMTADSLITNDTDILSSNIDTVSKWENAQYKNYLSIDDTNYGFDFPMFENVGYFIRVQ